MKFLSKLPAVVVIILNICCAYSLKAQTNYTPSINVIIIPDEADCVMNILNKKSENKKITEEDWHKLFSSEGYIRLKKREDAMKRSFTDEEFKSFVLSDTLFRKTAALAKALEQWKKADINKTTGMALAYLPERASIKAKIYIEIKPKSNSFVFDLATDPAIFLYLNTDVSKAKFENTLSHELHHIGFSQNCNEKYEENIKSKQGNAADVLNWIGAFGEGFAMIAAAGGADIHPHAVSLKEDKERWDRDVQNFNEDLKKVEAFFIDVLDGELKGDAISEKAMEFFGYQGPWYTLGWKMSMVIEKISGRGKLLECIINPQKLLPVYNNAVEEYNKKYNERLVRWSDLVIKSIL